MANNVTLTGAGGVTYVFRTTDLGGIHVQHTYDAAAQSMSVLAVVVGTSTAAPAVPADTSARARTIQNAGNTAFEISPVAGFALGNGLIIFPGAAFTTAYNGNIYARVTTATGNSDMRVESEG